MTVMYSSSRRKINCTMPPLRTKSVVHFKVKGPNSLVVEKLELFGSVNERSMLRFIQWLLSVSHASVTQS